jgi:hypothetical protein
METPLALIFLEIGLCRAHLQLPLRFGVLLLATMTRLECAVALLFPCLEGVAQIWGSKIKHYIFPLCVLSGYLAFSYYYYGVPLPQTLAAKRIVYDIPSSTIVSQLLLSFIGEDAPPHLTTTLYGVIALLTCLGGLIPLLCTHMKVERRFLAPALFSAVVFVGYCVNHVLLFPWYTPLITVPTFYSLIKQLSASSQVTSRIFTLVLSITYFLPIARFSVSEAYNHQSSPWFPSNDRTRMLSEIARTIPPEKLVAAPEIGAIGYSTSARIIDGIGLATPQALRHHPLAIPSQRANSLIGAIPLALVTETNPDIIIGVSGLIEGSEEKYAALGYYKTEYPVFRPEDEARHLKLSYLSRQKIYVWEKN